MPMYIVACLTLPLMQREVGQHDGQAGADEHEGVDGADPFFQVHVVRRGPGADDLPSTIRPGRPLREIM